ncbi:MAG TPA: reverse transcriptase domain-containing protein [Phycisphaerae bacterium]|nr:reverse transcriptase domain-containing protein [Phycisphaerae bacterium]HRY70699.1 reverse transcriptase domain-containing protein [Phycisphaerae bacterium]HSA28706.1 reverse transcriptase domain-containing protein [Phycisphaerae bacterium]
MKRYGGLWETLVCWENLVLAARKAQRGKRGRSAVQAFNFDLEEELLRLRTELMDGSYKPGAFRTRWITLPKPRLVSAAPYRDRVAHHALMNVMEPILDRHFHPDSYACRKGKGTHGAADRLQTLMRKHRYALQCDIQKFFPSIDHEILKGTFRRLIKDRRVLGLMNLIVNASNEQPQATCWFRGDDLFTPLERRRGLPIGNLTSQWFANWMLNGLDHYVTGGLGIGAYVRYCDDFILLQNDRRVLRNALRAIREKLAAVRLKLHEHKVFVRPVDTGLTFIGYRIWPSYRLLRKQNIRAFRRRVRWMRKAYAQGEIDWRDVKARLASWLGHAKRADSNRLVRRLSREWRFSRGRAEQASGSPRRQLEQQRSQLCVHEPQQQHAVQSEQQHRVPLGPALSGDYVSPDAGNLAVHGSRGCGGESPGSAPVLQDPAGGICGQTCVVGPEGAGRLRAERPSRFHKTVVKMIIPEYGAAWGLL